MKENFSGLRKIFLLCMRTLELSGLVYSLKAKLVQNIYLMLPDLIWKYVPLLVSQPIDVYVQIQSSLTYTFCTQSKKWGVSRWRNPKLATTVQGSVYERLWVLFPGNSLGIPGPLVRLPGSSPGL